MDKNTSKKKKNGGGTKRGRRGEGKRKLDFKKKNFQLKRIKGKPLLEISSGGVVYKKEKNKTLWLISRSKPSVNHPHDVWRLQKGWIDDSDTWGIPGPISRGKRKATEKELQDTALREVREEGGVEAEIISKIGTEKFFFNSKDRGGIVLKFVTFYLMEYTKDIKEGFDFETAEIKWLEFNKAYKTLTHKGEKEVLKKANKKLESGVQVNLI